MRAALVVVGLAALAAACSKPPEPDGSSKGPPEPKAASAPSQTAGSTSAPAEVVWDAPAAWIKAENPSPMRKATYKIPRAAGDSEDAELSVAQAGGTVEMNVSRWAGQFGVKPAEVKRKSRKVGPLQVTVVELRGTYSGMAMPGSPSAGPKPGWALLGAIVETSTPTFFKLTGPEKTVEAARADFEKFVETLRAK